MIISRLARTLTLAALLGGLSLGVHASPHRRPIPPSARGTEALIRCVEYYVSDHMAGHADPSTIRVNDIKSDQGWVVATATHPGLDPVFVVLKRTQRHWTGLTLGTNLVGVARQYHIPRRVWQKIGPAPY